MDRTHFDECKPAIQEAARRGLEHFRRPDPDQAIDSQPEQADQQEPAPDLNQATIDALGMVQAARHVLLTAAGAHARAAAAHILTGAAQALEQATEPCTRAHAPEDCTTGRDDAPQNATHASHLPDAGPGELAGRLASERPDTLAAAIDAGLPWAILTCRRRLMAARGILSAVTIENDTTLAMPEDTARALQAAMESLDAATVPENIGN